VSDRARIATPVLHAIAAGSYWISDSHEIGAFDVNGTTTPAAMAEEILIRLRERDTIEGLRARAEAAEAALAALREACKPALRVLDKLDVDEWAALNNTLTDTHAAAEAYRARVRREVLRGAAAGLDMEASAIESMAAMEAAASEVSAYPRSAVRAARAGAVREDAARLRAWAEEGKR
jgi:hypothetical protein